MFDKYDVARFWSKVGVRVQRHLCWEWEAGLFDNGYGQFKVYGQSTQAHRFAWAYFNGGGLDEWQHICHSCDNRKCCNPNHLFGGSAQDNVQDAIGKQRRESQRHARSGERNNFAKVNAEIVTQIRTAYDKGNVRQQMLADHFGISRAGVGLIVNRKTWKHV
jgi:predicted XRE-type DNA-binding protein